jgi:hypothetical protein
VTVPNEIRDAIRLQAGNVCEYCRLPAYASALPHQIDHIIGRQHRGSDDIENLCLCCIRCNLKKGPNIASIDPDTGLVTALYHPRKQVWGHHFRVIETRIVGLTAEGRTTVGLLEMNGEDRIRLRHALVRRGWIP